MSNSRVDQAVASTTKPRPSWLKALGDGAPPERLVIAGREHHLVEVFKHDSWAATSLYATADGRRRVVKIHRLAPAFGAPLSWVGRLTARREAEMLGRLADLPGIPALAGPVLIDGVHQDHAVARDFLDGHPLGDREAVDDRFFPALSELLAAMHRRGIAYVDLHKRENVLVDDRGAPCLFDFQISVAWPKWLPPWPVFSILRGSDEYHLMKHWSRCRPDQCGVFESQLRAHRPWWIRAHRLVARPFRELRRRLLVRIGVRTGKGRVDSEQFAEHALRSDGPSDRLAA